ncbi:MAG: hypothetical protein QM535_10885 [Limnohabitans sp.]|nr:hypothetical protein [Limnohabitans sp.]
MELAEIISIIKEKGLTGYKIAEDTGLTQVGIDKILNGSSKKPHLKTLKILENYIKNNSENYVNESSEKYNVNSKTDIQILKIRLDSAENRIKLLENHNQFLMDVVLKKLNELPVKEIGELHEDMTRKKLIEELKDRKK